jgi:hypothetical protein
MLTAIEYIRTRGRMCSEIACSKCSVSYRAKELNTGCIGMQVHYPEEVLKFVEQWGKEHPVKTIKDDLLEKYPNAKLDERGIPVTCVGNLGYRTEESYICISCKDCWDTPLEEVNK